jgi:hypothetical protein
MLTLGTHFQALLDAIRPPDHRVRAAQVLPHPVRDYLADHSDFKTLSPHSILVGSYAQNMSVGDVKDVDFLVRMPGNPGANDPEAKAVIRDLKSALDDLPSALSYAGNAGIDIERARRSVHVYFESQDFHLDVVPCIAPNGFGDVIYVPDRGFNEWIPSHPVGYIALLNQLDNDNGAKVKPLGRLLKHFRNFQMKTRQPKSYWLGALLVYHVRESLDMTEALPVLFRDLLDAIYNKFSPIYGRTDDATPNLPDPVLGHNVSWNWQRSHFETFMRRVDDGRGWARKALDAPDRDIAIGYWQRVFGEDYFPSDITTQARSLAEGAWPGKSAIGASGLVLFATAAASSRRVATPPTRFHGGCYEESPSE